MTHTDVGSGTDTTELEPVGGSAPGPGGLRRVLGTLIARRRPDLVPAVASAAALAIVVGLELGTGLDLLQAVVAGLQSGAVYALVALGITLVYKATNVLNFAQGELGTVPAFFVFVALAGFDPAAGVLPEEISTLSMVGWSVVAVALGAVLAMAINTLIVQRLVDSSPVTALVATIGIALLLTASELIVFGAQARRFPRFVEGTPCLSSANGECTVFLSIGGVRILWNVILVIAVLTLAAGLLAAFFRTPPGIALLATAQEPYAAELHGVSVRTMSTIAWGAAGALGAVAGILGAGVFTSLTPGLVTSTFLIPAFTGAVLGGLTSMSGAVVGGLLLGVSVALANEVWSTFGLADVVPGPPQVVTFALLLAVLLLRPQGLLGGGR